MAVARDDLGRDRLDLEPHLFGHIGFDGGIDIGEGADGAGNGAGGDLFLGRDQAAFGALELGVIAGELQAEGHGLGVDAVAAADGRGVLMLLGAGFQRGQDAIDAFDQQVRRPGQLDRETGVQHVRRGHALVQETGFLADDLGHVGQEGDDVVLGGAFDLVDPVGVEGRILALGPDGVGRRLGDDAQFGHLGRRMGLDLEPDLVLGLLRPDGGGVGAGIARDHGAVVSVRPPSESRFAVL